MPEPYIPKQPNDLIRAADWNQIQIDARTDVEQHDHTGGAKGKQLGTSALADGSITTAKLADAAVTGAKIAAGTITADKLDPNLELGGTVDDASITTAKLADAAVTAQKIALGTIDGSRLASSLTVNTLNASNDLRSHGASVRAEYDAVGFDWGWQLGHQIVGIASPLIQVNIKPFLNTLANMVGNMEAADLRAVRIITDRLEPELVRFNDVGGAWDAAVDEGVMSLLEWALPGVDLDAAVANALEIANFAWKAYLEDKFPYPNMLLALARQGQPQIVDFANQANNPIHLLDLFSNLPFGQCFDEVLAGFMRPLGTIDSDSNRPMPPLLDLDPDERFDESIFAVEAEVTVRTYGYVMLGIGTAEMPPPPGHWHAIGPVQPVTFQQVLPAIRARLHRDIVQFKQRRTARLWGVTWRSNLGENTVHEALLGVNMHARSIGPRVRPVKNVKYPTVTTELADELIKREKIDEQVDLLSFNSDSLPLKQD
ncbi:hypothetical protein ACNOYE_07780 [Nannocystaceae bacterium ST9]